MVYYLGGPWNFGSDANLSLPVFQVERFDNEEPTKNGILVEGFNPARGKKKRFGYIQQIQIELQCGFRLNIQYPDIIPINHPVRTSLGQCS